MAEHRSSYDDAGNRSNSPLTKEKAIAYLVPLGYGIIPPGAGPTVPETFQREATPYPDQADRRSPSSGSSTPLSDPPDSDMDEAPSISRHGSFSSLHNAASIDRNNQPGLSRRGSELSLPDAPPLNAATDTTIPARRSSMSKPGNKGQRLRRTVSFSMTRNTAASPPPVQVNLLATAYSRCKLFVLSYVDIATYTMDNRPAMCLPMFRLQPPPYLSAAEKETYQKFLQRLVDALNLPLDSDRGLKDRASRARRELWQLWFFSRDEWVYWGQPTIDFDSKLLWKAYDRVRHCHVNEDGSVYTG